MSGNAAPGRAEELGVVPLGRSSGSRTVLVVTPAECQLTLRYRTKSLQGGSGQFRANTEQGSAVSCRRRPHAVNMTSEKLWRDLQVTKT